MAILTKVYTPYILNIEVIYIQTTIRKWGNSNAVRLPRAIIEKTGLGENDQVELLVEDGNIIIVPCKKHITLRERAADYSGNYKPGEWDTGRPTGKEIW